MVLERQLNYLQAHVSHGFSNYNDCGVKSIEFVEPDFVGYVSPILLSDLTWMHYDFLVDFQGDLGR